MAVAVKLNIYKKNTLRRVNSIHLLRFFFFIVYQQFITVPGALKIIILIFKTRISHFWIIRLGHVYRKYRQPYVFSRFAVGM